ncbi:MAG: glycoside hydrolase family 1 protein [Verrucomicrobia bacterium]|nr:glycoside hydrolase family 1 protein [Verrucomicrobiota bacterium]
MSEFLWGVATSAYQAEGGYNGPGQPQTNWAEVERRGDVASVGLAADFWNRFPEDFARCRDLGLNAFRLGLEWSRIQPTHVDRMGAPPPFNAKALDHYVEMLAECRRNDLEPVVTLHHFVHPAWLGSDPWLDPTTGELFARYVEHTLLHVNRALIDRHGLPPIRYYITINEPNMLVLNTYLGTQFPGRQRRLNGLRTLAEAYRNILSAHLRAYNLIHRLAEEQGWPDPMVTFNNYCSDLYWSDKVLLDLLSIRERGVKASGLRDYVYYKIREFERAFADAALPLKRDLPSLAGSLTKRMSNWLGYKTFMPDLFRSLADELYAAERPVAFDYIGLDYYDPFAVHIFRLPVWWDHEFKDKSLRSWLMSSFTSKWWDWRVLPAGMHFFCEYYSRDYGDRKVLIAENGMALRRRSDNRNSQRRDRMTRSRFLKLHIAEVNRMVAAGVPLLGYLHWSLFDNYEWGSFTPRFGLYAIDYQRDNDRLVEDHLGDRPSLTYARLVSEARQLALEQSGVTDSA